MPTYSYLCENCQVGFELQMSMAEYDRKNKPKCPACGKVRKVRRNLAQDLPRTFVKLGDDEIKLGHLASRNSERLSPDEKDSITKKHNEYRDQPFTGSLPEGATPMGKNPPTKQRKKDPRKKKK